MQEKEEILKDIKELLEQYDQKVEFGEHILKYLSFEELKNIKANILKKQENIIEENRKWLYGLVK